MRGPSHSRSRVVLSLLPGLARSHVEAWAQKKKVVVELFKGPMPPVVCASW